MTAVDLELIVKQCPGDMGQFMVLAVATSYKNLVAKVTATPNTTDVVPRLTDNGPQDIASAYSPLPKSASGAVQPVTGVPLTPAQQLLQQQEDNPLLPSPPTITA